MPNIQYSISHIDLELTNYCNLSCWMCPRNDMTRKVGYIDPDIVKKIAASPIGGTLKTMNLHLFGESILHPKLRQILEILRAAFPNVWLSFSTNGSFLTVSRFKELVGLLDNLYISIDGISEEVYAAHRVGSNYQKTIANITEVLAHRKQHSLDRPRVEIRMIDLGQAENERNKYFEYWQPHLLQNDNISIKPVESFAGTVSKLADIKRDSCPFLYRGVAIHWNGDVSTCCYDSDGKNVMGNVMKHDLLGIFRSKKYEEMRTWYETGTLQNKADLLCHTCLVENYMAKKA